MNRPIRSGAVANRPWDTVGGAARGSVVGRAEPVAVSDGQDAMTSKPTLGLKETRFLLSITADELCRPIRRLDGSH